MAGLYQEGKRFPMYEEGKRFPTGGVPPPTMADYLRFLETQKRTRSIPPTEGMQPGLASANAPSPEDTIWRGKGLYGEQAFTNIPERAQALDLRETMPPVPEGGYIETIPTGKTFAVESPQAQVGGQGRSYAEKLKARQKLESHIFEKGIPMAEAMKLQEFWGVDNDSLDKAQKAEVSKPENLPPKIEEFEMLFPEMKGKRGTEEYKKAYMNITARGQQGDFRNESSMRKEFLTLPEVKDYPTVQQQSQRALAALKASGDNMVAVDQSIITTFNKMLDPTSVVRESEYARTAQDMALLNRIKGKWDKLSTGGAGLTSEERQAMARMVSAFKDIADEQYNQQVDYYSGLAERYGYQPENVVRLGGKKAEAPIGSPTPTTGEWSIKRLP